MASATKSKFIVRKRQERGERRIADIIEVSSQSFAEHGFDGTSMNSIAQRAGLSIGSLYQYFPNKEAIVDAVAAEYVRSWHARTDSLQKREFRSLRELILAAIGGHVEFLRRNAGIKAFLDADPRRLQSIQDLQKQIEFGSPLLSHFYPTKSHAQVTPVVTLAAVVVDGVAMKVAAERTAAKRAWFVAELTEMLLLYVEAQLGKSK